MKTILERVNKEYNKLTADGRVPGWLFTSVEGQNHLAEQAAKVYGINKEEAKKIFLDMTIQIGASYQGDAFRIYCKPEF